MDQNNGVRIKQANLASHALAISIADQAEAQLKGHVADNVERTAAHLGCQLAEVTYMVDPKLTFVEDGRVVGGMMVDLEFSQGIGGESVDGKFMGTLAADGRFTLTGAVAHTDGLH